MSGECLEGVLKCIVADYEFLVKVLAIMMLDQAQKFGVLSFTYLHVFFQVSSKGKRYKKEC